MENDKIKRNAVINNQIRKIDEFLQDEGFAYIGKNQYEKTYPFYSEQVDATVAERIIVDITRW